MSGWWQRDRHDAGGMIAVNTVSVEMFTTMPVDRIGEMRQPAAQPTSGVAPVITVSSPSTFEL
jgi:uncharacterized protein (DUF2126 family)